MIITIVLNLLNIYFNILFIYGFGMLEDGGAYGTLISTYLALGLAIVLFLLVYYAGTFYFGAHGLWLAMVLFMISRGVALAYYIPRTVMEHIKEPRVK